MLWRLIFISFFCCSVFIKISAQQLYYQNLNTEKGLPSDLIFDLASDKNGLIFLGTQYGMYSFNGIEFKKIPFYKHKSNSISSIVITDNNTLWCRNFSEQIFYYKNDTMIYFDKLDSFLKGDIIIDLKAIGNKIYVAAFNNIYEIDNKTLNVNLFCKIKDIETFAVYKNKLIVADVHGSVYEVEKEKITKIAELPFNFTRICVQDNAIYFVEKASSKGEIYVLKKNVLNHFVSINFPSQIQVNNFIAVDNNNIAVSTNKGMYVIDINRKEKFIISENYRTSDILKDRENNYWISTLDNGLIKIPSLSVKFILPQNNTHFYSHVYPYNQQLLLATNIGNVYLIDTTGKILNSYYSNTGKEIEFLYYHKTDDKIYTSIGDFDVKTKNFNSFYYGKNISFDSLNNLYFALHSISGIIPSNNINSIFNLNDLQSITLGNKVLYEIRKHRSRAVLSDNDSSLYVAYSDNLYHYTSNKEKIIYDIDGSSIYAIDLKKGYNNSIWIATTQNGIYNFNHKTIKKHYTTQNGLSGNICRKLFVDSNFVYVLTENGLDKISTLNDNVFSVTNAFGINNLTFYDFYITDNKIILLSNEGVLTIPNTNNSNFQFPSLFITKAYCESNIEFKPNEEISFFRNSPQFTFQLLSYNRSKNTLLKYKLQGLDTVWNEIPSQINYLKFNNLKHGNYNLQIIAENQVLVEFPFKIKKPFWLTWWFIFIEVIIGIVIIYITYIITKNRLRKQQLFKEKLILSQLTALRSQMNPHFLYNVLNSLQGLIYSNKINEAGTYISKFSDHLRNTLNLSDKQEITIKEEIEGLKTYLDLEKLRFGDEFSFEIIKTSDVNDYLKIPALIIQPFVENAVKHGLLNKKGEKKLSIVFKMNNNNLIVLIEDNGIGRKASQKFNERRKDKPESFATNAINSRIELINKQRSKPIYINITDLVENNNSIGTRVELIIPT
ncbi:MAG: sensor histidine kinase [Bacteroidia bacterium]